MTQRNTEGALLFVRSAEDLPEALEAANALLSRRRRGDRCRGEVLGICVRPDLGAELEGPCTDLAARPEAVARESVGALGVWDLRWFDLPERPGRPSDADRRQRLLRRLAAVSDAARRSTPKPLFFVVLTPAELDGDVANLLEGLRERYPGLLIDRQCFCEADGGLTTLTRAPRPKS